MLEIIKLILAYLEWVCVVFLGLILAWGLQCYSIVISIALVVFCLFLIWLMHHLSSKKYSEHTRIAPNNYIMGPLMDVVLIYFALASLTAEEEWEPFVILMYILIAIDLIRWLLNLVKNK